MPVNNICLSPCPSASHTQFPGSTAITQTLCNNKHKESKDTYRRKLGKRLQRKQTRNLWSGMRAIPGFQRRGRCAAEGNVDQANELNQFFNRFKSSSPSLTCPPTSPLRPLDFFTPSRAPNTSAFLPISPCYTRHRLHHVHEGHEEAGVSHPRPLVSPFQTHCSLHNSSRLGLMMHIPVAKGLLLPGQTEQHRVMFFDFSSAFKLSSQDC